MSDKICSVDGCRTKASTKGFCRKHYCQIWKYGHIVPEKECPDLPGEIWKDVPGYNGDYKVSNFGRVKSYKNNKWGRTKHPFLMSQIEDAHGYWTVSLCKDSKHKRKRVHRLVALAFIPNPENKPEVNHIDGNVKNASLDNLEWATGKENVRHSIDVLGKRPGAYLAKAIRCIETGEEFESSAAAGRAYGMHRNNASKAARGKLQTAKNLHWEFVDKQ